jgi:tRNA threonylcarbamoyladenosine biosynthesis protein TsaB
MPVLGIDTATAHASVALARPGEVLAEEPLEALAGHSRDLLERIDGLLKRIGAGPRDLAGIGVTVGPGSFTGVRIGMATAKGLGYSLNVGVAGISTLEALARAARAVLPAPLPAAVCAVLDAGRGEVYGALFRLAAGGEPERATPDRSWRPEDLLRAIQGDALLVGDGCVSVSRAAREAGRSPAVLDPPPALAGAVALWACGAVPPGSTYRPGTLGPNYIRPADAEVSRRRS